MTILKRFELWLLVLLLAGVAVFILTTGDPSKGDGDGPARSGESPEAFFTVDATHLKRDYSNAILEVHLTCRNDSGAALELSPPTARLLSGPNPEGAEEVKPFFLAFAPPPTVPAGESGVVVLKYWIEKGHLENALWLTILEETRLVKSPAPLELESIANQESVVFEGTEWARAGE